MNIKNIDFFLDSLTTVNERYTELLEQLNVINENQKIILENQEIINKNVLKQNTLVEGVRYNFSIKDILTVEEVNYKGKTFISTEVNLNDRLDEVYQAFIEKDKNINFQQNMRISFTLGDNNKMKKIKIIENGK